MKVYLIRHGETVKDRMYNDDGYPDPILTELGVKQAQMTGEYLSKIQFDAIYSSDLRRAFDTAKTITDYQNKIEVITDKRIREINMGILHTLNNEQAKYKYPDFYEEFMKKETDFIYPEGESGEILIKRVLSFIEILDVIEMKDCNVCIVCHGGVIKSVMSHYLGLSQSNRFKLPVCNCGISILEYDYDRDILRPLAINEVSHLGENYTF